MRSSKFDLWKGDCLELMKDIPDGSVDLILTDPPYGTTACKWDSVIPFDLMWEQLKRIIKPKGAVVLFSAQPFTTTLISSNIKCFKYCMVWKKSKCGSPLTAKYKPLTKHEDLCIFSLHNKTLNYYPQMQKGEPYKRKYTEYKVNNHGFGIKGVEHINDGTRHPSTVLDYSQKWRRQDQLHPTQKPVELLEYLIKTYTNENETVLDFTAGSFSTAIACLSTNRNFIGIELDDGYFDIGVKRIKEHIESNNMNVNLDVRY